jgi:ankyrin repeat protein
MIILFFSAARSGHIEVVKELLHRNADKKAKDKSGNTALISGIVFIHLILISILHLFVASSEGHAEVVKEISKH